MLPKRHTINAVTERYFSVSRLAERPRKNERTKSKSLGSTFGWACTAFGGRLAPEHLESKPEPSKRFAMVRLPCWSNTIEPQAPKTLVWSLGLWSHAVGGEEPLKQPNTRGQVAEVFPTIRPAERPGQNDPQAPRTLVWLIGLWSSAFGGEVPTEDHMIGPVAWRNTLVGWQAERMNKNRRTQTPRALL